ncbi:hypothetical protein [Paludisphaera rhizosphaerae]|uniref:hypothetical protein n=1 Tax=Paludisphaera rhizosphaerae TaxID=2711216 RepID=UPI001F10C2BF|nr:hypothetical protein [Paludisphaera rhizosphaerae]
MMKRCSIVRSYYACAAAVLAACGLAGCGGEAGDGLPREAVSGGVTVDGKPLKSGIALFLPVDPNNPTQGNFTVIDGKYNIAKEQGLIPGKYSVKISSSVGEEKKESESLNGGAPGMPPSIPKDAIPPMYNSDTKLAAEVKAGIPNDFQFALSTAKPTK